MPDGQANTIRDMFVSPDDIRTAFCAALSAMYRAEVPLYGDLIELVDEVNEEIRHQGGSWEVADRLRVERHGAIRLGLPAELTMMARLFRQMGMFPVGYYDLSTSSVPVHATAFRPVTDTALEHNPFRVFTSLLRPELIPDVALRRRVIDTLQTRDIFHPQVKQLVEKAESQGGLGAGDADQLVRLGLETFRWHETALVDEDTYSQLQAVHPLLADIVGFRGPHINHLTPRVLDIDAAQSRMVERHIPYKRIIEGPPARQCPILLRQTSFQALTEPICFVGGAKGGTHRARFGEIESRGVAVTPEGHALYLKLLAEVDGPSDSGDETNEDYQIRLGRAFAQYPDTWSALRKEHLAYFRYQLTYQSVPPKTDRTLEDLMADGVVTCTPMVYEDFLPASAAGIFQSNLGAQSAGVVGGGPKQAEFEEALGYPVLSYFDMYASEERRSIDEVVRLTGCRA